MISVGIIGGTGYTGKKLIQFCENHPFIEEYEIYANSSANEYLNNLFPDFYGVIPNKKIKSIFELSYDHDLYFVSLPHGESLKYIPTLISHNKKVIDLGGDYRLDFEELYLQWYGFNHTSAYLLHSKVYGLADFYKTNYENVQLIANPGCYPTAILLALLPVLSKYSENILSVSCSAYSGTSGAGKSAKTDYLLSEMDGNVKAYNINSHKHEPEILQSLYRNGFHSPFAFTTHILPIAVGIYTTSFIHLKEEIDRNELFYDYENFYKDSPFVRLRNHPPELKWVVNTNFCDINISIQEKKIVITSAIDNLIKGASGQAIQNMNRLYNWDQSLGLLNKEMKNVAVY